MNTSYTFYQKKTIKLSELLLWCLAFWPFFWNVWAVFKPTTSIGTSTPMYSLWGITVIMLIFHSRLKRSFLLTWFLFLGVVALESLSRPTAVINDLSVILCGVMFCMVMYERKADYRVVLKCLIVCGLVVSICVILDNLFFIFNDNLLFLYTDEARKTKMRLSTSGGLLPHTGSAGCFIYSGLASYITLIRVNGKTLKRIGVWFVVMMFLLSALLIQKRGLILAALVGYVSIKAFQITKEDFKRIYFQQQLRRIISLIAFILFLFVLYCRVPLVHNSIDSLVGRFLSSDETYSGRTELYKVAISLFQGHALWGIGWGRYRLNTIGFFGDFDYSYEAHNVYMQLLCETGIIGLVTFLIAVISSLFYGIRKYRRAIKLSVYGSEIEVVRLGLFMQVFFLIYCMSGNPLYDYNFCITYFIGIILSLIPFSKEV